jgi:arylsulfatase A-like enzyme
MLRTFALGLTACFALAHGVLAESTRPNILWIYAEDTSPWMECYGSTVNAGQTPNIDSIARQGVRFTRAFVPAPVCSACRSSMITGQSQIRLGVHEHRSGRGKHKIYLPDGVKPIPQIFKEHGYSTFNFGKTDYNFEDTDGMYSIPSAKEGAYFDVVKTRQPFFGQIQTAGGKSGTKNLKGNRNTSPNDVVVPADYPQNNVFRETVAQHHDAIRVDDDRIGKILKQLKAAGLADNTIVVYFSDHGANNLLRHKQMCTEGGLHVPFVMMGPEKYVPLHQKVRTDLVTMLDLSATSLAWAGIPLPDYFEGRNLFAADHQPRTAVFGAKDRLDHTIDRVRTVRTENYRYIRNFKLDRIFLQPQYRDKRKEAKNLHELYAAGRLAPHLKDIYFGERPAEELYKVSEDPAMITNLVNEASMREVLEQHRQLLDDWLAKGDLGAEEEPIIELQENGDDRHWGIGVNAEYETYRTDTDGDGLSDIWEKTNGRDPADGMLQFEFNCGGWQTEGWTSSDIDNNLAGYLGSLDFVLNKGEGTLSRKGLALQANDEDKEFLVRMKSDAPYRVSLYLNGEMIHSVAAEPTKDLMEHHFLLNKQSWKGTINSIDLKFHQSKPGSRIEVDRIAVLR